MTVAAMLFQLEQLERDLERREAELRDIRRREGNNPELGASEKRLAGLQDRERAASAEQRSFESDLSELETKIKRDQTRMYSGQIVDSRELGSLERELEHYRQRRDELEGRYLESMDPLEALQSQLAALTQEVNAQREGWETNRPELSREAENITEALAALRVERDALAASIDPRSLDVYHRIRASIGHAVSQVSEGICQSCRVGIPAKDIQHAWGDRLVTCSNCARILYVGT